VTATFPWGAGNGTGTKTIRAFVQSHQGGSPFLPTTCHGVSSTSAHAVCQQTCRVTVDMPQVPDYVESTMARCGRNGDRPGETGQRLESFRPRAVACAQGKVPSPWSFLEDSAGRIWVGTIRQGAYVIDSHTGGARIVEESDEAHSSSQNEGVSSIVEIAPGHVWLGTLARVIVAVDASHITDAPYPPRPHAAGQSCGRQHPGHAQGSLGPDLGSAAIEASAGTIRLTPP